VIENAGREGEVGKPNRVEGVQTAKSIAGVSLALMATPFALAAMLLCAYGVFFLAYLLSH
jgi:hypothetical protein